MAIRLTSLLAILLALACSGGGTVPPAGGGGGNQGGPPPANDGIAEPHAPSQVLVILESPDEPGEADEILEDFSGLQLERVGQSSIFRMTVPDGTNLADLVQGMDDDLRVILSEPNYSGGSPEGGPSDVPILGGDLLDAIAQQDALAQIGVPGAHARSTGAGVLVAVVDTGLDSAHPYFAGRVDLGRGYDFISDDPDPSDERHFSDNDGDGLVDEQYGHGTFVASLVLAVAPDARILPVRVLDPEGFGTSHTVAAGIIWAVDAGARVINVSVDLPTAPEVVKEAVHYAEDRDVVLVAAAGNSSQPDLIFPARFSDVVGVSSVDASNVLAPFSNFGSQVSLTAPGVQLIGALPFDRSPSGTGRWSGTSFSSPLVAGAAALVRAAFPQLDRKAVAQRLRDSATPIDAFNPGRSGQLGAGLVRTDVAVAP